MPSFSSFLKSSRLSQQIDPRDVDLHNGGATEKDHPSKRAFFKRLLRRSSVNTKSSSLANRLPNHGKSVNPTSPTPELPTPSPNTEPPSSPMSDPNKPLPPPPPPESAAEQAPTSKPSVKLDRIIAPLALADLQKLFSGAPHFFARSEGHGTGAAHPSVAYPYNTELNVRDLKDHVMIQDEAWTCVTAWPHVTCQDNCADHEEHKAHFVPRCRERPSMLSMQGLERGTMGFQAALEMGVADALQNPDEDSHNEKVVSEHRWRFLNGKEGARPLTDSALIERLSNVSESYHEGANAQPRHSVELYTELFTQIIHPPSRVTDANDPYSLHVQIEALVRVLGMEHVWFDFSKVEWRIRLGLLLWGSSHEPDFEAEVNDEVFHEQNTQRFWLLLQILLSCELLIRLDMVSKNYDAGESNLKPEEIHRFEKKATTSVRWSIILARQWLENIRIQKTKVIPAIEEKPATGWLASLTGAAQPEAAVQESINDLKFEGRHQVRQIRGLVHFARKINWPNVDKIVGKVSANGITISESMNNSPIGTPRSVSTQRSSYFSNRPGLRRGLSSINDRMSAIIHPAGWLSNSYVSGLILPGESLSHFLISTLLENDPEAVAKLGEEANLYGGFVYQSKSFWSTSCVVGRVLAAGKNSAECMGWISSDVIPRGVKEEWIDIDVESMDDAASDKKEKRPRILRKTTIEQRGHILGGADISSALPGDFFLPSDEPSEAAVAVTFESLDLFATEDSIPPSPTKEKNGTPLSETTQQSEPPRIKLFSAMMRFSLQVEGEAMKEVNLSLTNDVYFLTVHPCIPSQSTIQLHSPTSPSFHSSSGYRASEHAGHPLHKAFTYAKIPLSHVLAMPSSTSFSSFLSPPQSPSRTYFSTHTTSSNVPKVLIIDCTDATMDMFPPQPSSTSPSSPGDHNHEHGHGGSKAVREHTTSRFGSDLEMLGRALCVERGWNALVSRRGRGCLACAVREAGAVGWRVILRVA